MSKPCGLYKTTKPIPTGTSELPAPTLVYFHNHSEQGPPIIVLPEKNTHNKWAFSDKGFLLKEDKLVDQLEALKPEGFYRVKEHFHPDDSRFVPKDALVQLGYNGAGDPIIFFPNKLDGKNAVEFPTQGMKVPPAVYDLLEALDMRGPVSSSTPHLH